MIKLTKKQLSDLFYGFKKPFFEEADQLEFENLDEVQPALDAAILKDATVFSDIIGKQVAPDYLLKDFKERIKENEACG